MTIESNRNTLKNQEIEIRGKLRQRLKARHLEWMVSHLEDDLGKEVFQIIITERNERANINQAQDQDIARKAGRISRLERDVTYWKQVADDFKQAFDAFQNLAIHTTSELHHQLVHNLIERSELIQGVQKIKDLYSERRA